MFLLTTLLCLFSATLSDLQRDGPTPTELTYSKPGTTVRNLYLFPAAGARPDQRSPAFVWIHGGGWTSGDAQSGFPHARYFASRGMVSFSVEYGLAKAGGPFVSDAVADCRAALVYIRAHAAELGVDQARITVAGDSAGAHLAAALGSEDLASAMVLYNGIYDLTVDDRMRLTGSAEASRKVSPLFAVHKGEAPAIVLHGLDDRSVSPDQSRRFAAAMKESGNRCDLVLVDDARHAFVLPEYTAPEYQVVKAIRDGDAFLASLGYIHGEPTLEALAAVPAPREGWWVARHKEILARIQKGSVDLVLIGDSITQNYERSKLPDENFKPTWDRFYEPRHAVNLGFSGDTTGNVEWRLEHGEIDGIKPKAAVILIGTNDTGHGESAEQTSAGVDEIVRRVHVKCPSTKILLLGILPSGVSEAKSKADAAVNADLARRYASVPYVAYLDVSGVFMREGKLQESLFYDPKLSPPRGALHPDTNGQRLMAEAVEVKLAELMNH
jgi:acetyl esterase/lipase/lysophospholipase L1-like esterase